MEQHDGCRIARCMQTLEVATVVDYVCATDQKAANKQCLCGIMFTQLYLAIAGLERSDMASNA